MENQTIAIIQECTNFEAIAKQISVDSLEDFFKCGIPSTKLKIGFLRSQSYNRAKTVKIPIERFSHKAVILPYDSGYCIWPMLHHG